MIKGEISNFSGGLVGIDYRVLIYHENSYTWLSTIIPKLLLEAGYDKKIKDILHLDEHMIRWLNSKIRSDFENLFVFSIGVPLLISGINNVLADYVNMIEHFETYGEFYEWLGFETNISCVYTYDSNLLNNFRSNALITTPRLK